MKSVLVRSRTILTGRKKTAVLLFTLLLSAAILAFVLSTLMTGETPGREKHEENRQTSESTEPAIEEVKGKYLFSGTIVLGRAVERAAQKPGGGYDYNQPFSRLHTLDIDQYDAGVIDLECPSTGRRVSYEESVNSLIFDCHPDWFPDLSKYFQIMNLAGNHTYDAGADGFMKTVENIQNAGLQAVGHYSPRVIEDLCEIVAMPVRLQTSAGGEERGALPLAICSFHYQFGFLPEPGELETIKQYSEVMPVIGMMHAGHEYTSKANEHQRSFAHQMIDYGAEFVVSNGAHWVQDTEVYKGKLIVYSTGNFIFDQLGYEERLGLSLAVDMSVPYDENLVGWLELGEDCKPRNDACLSVVREQSLRKFIPSFTFEAIGSFGGARRVTERASEVQQQDIERRANWAQTKRMLEAAVR